MSNQIQILSVIHSDINRRKGRHSRESGNPEKHWIPGQARNDKLYKSYVVMYKNFDFELCHSFGIWVLTFDIELS